MTLKLSPKPDTVKLIRKARQLTSADVAIASGISTELLGDIEREPTELSKSRIVSLAKALAVPTQFLFYANLEIEQNLPDFRTVGNRPAILTSAGLARVEKAKSIVSYLDDDLFEEDEKAGLVGCLDINVGINAAAEVLRKYYTPIKRVDGSVDPTSTFRETRVAIEKEGAIVLCDRVANDSFRGFCFSEKGRFPLILINTADQRPATKLFTLMHEIVHVLLGRTGISDPNVLENNVERFCNKVTATVMMPVTPFTSYFQTIKSGDIRKRTTTLAQYFGVSKQAAALRVNELGLQSDYYSTWLKSLPPRVPQIEEEDPAETTGGGGIAAQVGRFGYLLPKVLGNAVNKHSISIIDAYRLTNLKPKTIVELAKIGENRLGH